MHQAITTYDILCLHSRTVGCEWLASRLGHLNST